MAVGSRTVQVPVADLFLVVAQEIRAAARLVVQVMLKVEVGRGGRGPEARGRRPEHDPVTAGAAASLVMRRKPFCRRRRRRELVSHGDGVDP